MDLPEEKAMRSVITGRYLHGYHPGNVVCFILKSV
jgi:hypothetical protein